MKNTLSFRLFKLAIVATCLLAWSPSPVQADVVFDWAVVGNPGNAPDQLYTNNNPNNLRFGAVGYNYRISKHEVTNAQYAEFLNNIAASDPNNLFSPNMDITRSGSNGSYTYSVNATFEPNPVNYVSFFDAMRFTNWLHNGQGAGGTESGVYTIGNGVNETRAAGARYFIPSEDEWYKAAYYDPRLASQGGPPGDDHYWLYPTQHDNAPTAEPPPGGVNSANFNFVVGDTTDVGAYVDTTGFYGTFDQGGNVWEWNEAVAEFSTARGLRGGSWLGDSDLLPASFRIYSDPTNGNGDLGFRVASVIPEPTTVVPDALTVFRGFQIGGTLEDVFESDDLRARFKPGLRINTAEAPIWLIFDAALPSDNPDGLEIVMESQAGQPGHTGTLEVWNWTRVAYDVVDVSVASFNQDTIVTVDLSSGISDYVEAGTGAVRTRVGWRKTAINAHPWEIRLDQMVWIVE